MIPIVKTVQKKTVLFSVFILFFGTVLNAQNFLLSGKVVDEKNTPLPGASISLQGASAGTSTDFEGNFKFELPQGKHILSISYIGYKSEIIEINISAPMRITIQLELEEAVLEEVIVNAVRVKGDAPVTFTNLDKREISKRNLGQDVPILLNYLPSVVTTSDAGAGVGYTGIRVRGSDATRVNVTINGIPFNDSESQGTYWVDLPDFSSSIENVQLQRGVGTSTNGSGAFGASLNILTDAVSENANGEISSSFGSYNTRKHTVKFSTGKINDHIEFAGRFSKIDSDGYIDRAWSDLKSYFLQAAYVDENTLIKALTFGGHERTYQAWYGTPIARIINDEQGVEQFIVDNWLSDDEAENLRNSDRRYNYYTYENEIDNYQQDHYQLHWNEKLSPNFTTNIGLNYTRGKGYFEQFKAGESFEDYDLSPIVIGDETINETDLIRRRWLDNDYYVVNANATYKNDKLEFIFGTSFSSYLGKHFGEIIWAQYASDSQIRDHYYDSDSHKKDANVFGKLTYKINDDWTLFTDLQQRFVKFNTDGITSDRELIDIDKNYSFFNPKVGLTLKANDQNTIYASFARASREPNRGDFKNGVTDSEKLNDFELGWRLNTENVKINTNLYYMQYKDQLVLTGAIDDTGDFIRGTSGKSYRFGLEVDATIQFTDHFQLRPNVAISSNKNVDFYASIDGVLLNLGNTNLSFSPNLIMGNIMTYTTDNFQVSLLSKYVGKQYLGNLDSKISTSDVLENYFVNDLNVTYEIKANKIFKSIVFSALVNNIFNTKYISNGYYYYYDDTWSEPDAISTIDGAGFYPQATRNFLLGATFKF